MAKGIPLKDIKKKAGKKSLPIKGEVEKPKTTRKSKGIPLKEVKETTTKSRKTNLPIKGEVKKTKKPLGATIQPKKLVGVQSKAKYTIPEEELLERELLRTPRQRYMDETHTSSKVISPNSPDVIKWWLHPEKYDIKGIDTAGSDPYKEMEKINPNFLKRYPFIKDVENRTMFPHSKGVIEQKEKREIPKKTVKKAGKKSLPIKGEVEKPKTTRKSKGIPLKEVKETTTKTHLPIKGEVKETTTKSRKTNLPIKGEVKKAGKKSLPIKGEVEKPKTTRKSKGIPLKEVKETTAVKKAGKKSLPIKGETKIKKKH